MNHKVKSNIAVMMIAATVMNGAECYAAKPKSQDTGSIAEARQLVEEGELYQAKKMTRELLKQKPEDTDTQYLMAQIIEREMVQEREVFGDNESVEDMAKDEKQAEAKTWLERSQSLMDIGLYEQAYSSAEKVFLYDPENHEASSLLDRIREKAFKNGKGQMLSLERVRQEEIQERIKNYRKEAEEWISQGRWGAARLAVEKILLLTPEDPEGLRLQQKINKMRDTKPE